MAVATVAGLQVDLKTRMVKDGRLPVKQRHYYGSRVSRNIRCYENGQYCNVELFQPVIYDRECKMPPFDMSWIEWDNPALKGRKMVRINFPYQYKAWWYEQRRRCIDGYTVGGVHLTGENYFYLNFWKVRGKNRGDGFITPRFLDVQKELFDIVDKARAEGKNLLTLKRRQIGFSECYASMIAHEYTLLPMSRGLIVGGEDEYALTTMSKLKAGLDAFHPNVSNAGREFYKRRKTGMDREDALECGFVSKGGIVTGYLSQVQAITTKDNAQAANGKTPTFCLLEEAGINALLDEVYGMVQPAMEEQGMQNGRIIVVNGTGGDMEAGAARLMKMFYNPDAYNILKSEECYETGITGTAHFFPAWKWYVMDEDGNSYKEAGLELLRQKRENSKESLTTMKTQFPFTPSEAFTLSGNCPFNTEKLEQQMLTLLEIGQKDYMQWGRLDWVFSKDEDVKKIIGQRRVPIGVQWVPCPQGKEQERDGEGDLIYPVCVLEHPEMADVKEGEEGFKMLFADHRAKGISGLYKAGMDPYNKDEAGKSAYSQGSITIAKGYLNSETSHYNFPANIVWRPAKKEKFYEMAVKLQCYYGMCKVLIEWSNDAPMDWYKNNGWEFLLKERPIVTQAEMINSTTVNRYGIDPNTKHVWEEHYAQYIEDYWFLMTDPVQVEKALAYRKTKKYNCDKTISCMLAWEHMLDDVHIGVKVRKNDEKKSNRMMIGYVSTIGGIRAIS